MRIPVELSASEAGAEVVGSTVSTEEPKKLTAEYSQADKESSSAASSQLSPSKGSQKRPPSSDVVKEVLDDCFNDKHSEQHQENCGSQLGDARHAIDTPMDFDLVNLYDSKDDLETHRKKSCLEMFKDYLMGTGFDMLIGFLIMANAIVMAIELEYGGSLIAPELGLPKDTELWPAADEAFFVLNHVFCVIFLMEFSLRVYSWGVKFFKSPANCVDAAIVWISVVDLYIMQPMGTPLPNVAFLRLLRIAKLLKALNIIKQLRPFRHLRVLCGACMASTGALMWSVIFLMFVHFMFAIFMTQMLNGFLHDEAAELEVQLQVYTYFGTVSRSLLTMWEITLTTGAWAKIGRLLIYEVDRIYTLFFVSYVYLFSFGAMKVISALFLKETLAAASNDQDMIIDEKVKRKNRFTDLIRNLFRKMDTDDSGSIELDELKTFMSNPAGAHWFYMLDIEAPELYQLFSLLDQKGTGKVDFSSFITGVNQLAGGARSLDIVELQVSTKVALEDIAQTLHCAKGIAAELKELKTVFRNSRTPPTVCAEPKSKRDLTPNTVRVEVSHGSWTRSPLKAALSEGCASQT